MGAGSCAPRRRRHPLGVYPLGNSLLDPDAGPNRSFGLGHFSKMQDELLLTFLGCLSPRSCSHLGCTSAVLHAFCGHDELWRDFCLQAIDAGARLVWAPEGTWHATYILSCAREDVRRPALGRTKVHIYSDVLYRGFVVATTELKQGWLARETLERVDARGLTPTEFSRRFEQTSRPVILEGCALAWPAMHWSKESLLQQVGSVKFECGPCELPLSEFYAYADRNLDDAPLFVFDKLFSGRAPALLQDFEVPSVFRGLDLFDLMGDQRPDFRWLLIGNRRSGSKWHIDPNKTTAWNAVVRGRKRWLLLPPACQPPGVFPSLDGAEVTQPVSLIEWFSNFYGELRRLADSNPAFDLQEGTCGPGDAVFIPCGWWHCVLNLDDDTIGLTQNYASESQVHSVRRFLREKPDQVSGVPADRKAHMADLFDAALKRHRPELLTATQEKVKQDTDVAARSADKDAASTQSTGFSFWDHLRSTGRSLAFGDATHLAKEGEKREDAGQVRGELELQEQAPSPKRPKIWLDAE